MRDHPSITTVPYRVGKELGFGPRMCAGLLGARGLERVSRPYIRSSSSCYGGCDSATAYGGLTATETFGAGSVNIIHAWL